MISRMYHLKDQARVYVWPELPGYHGVISDESPRLLLNNHDDLFMLIDPEHVETRHRSDGLITINWVRMLSSDGLIVLIARQAFHELMIVV